MKLNLVGVDLSKSVFQLSIANANNHIVSRKRLSRTQFRRWLSTSEPRHLVMEACGTSHYWARVTEKLGHQVSLLHPKYVKPYVRRNKTSKDAAELEEFPILTTALAMPDWISKGSCAFSCLGLLAPVGITLNRDVDCLERALRWVADLAGQQDGAGAGAQHGF